MSTLKSCNIFGKFLQKTPYPDIHKLHILSLQWTLASIIQSPLKETEVIY